MEFVFVIDSAASYRRHHHCHYHHHHDPCMFWNSVLKSYVVTLPHLWRYFPSWKRWCPYTV